MDVNVLLIVIFAVMAAGLIATLKLGFSKENNRENSEYGKKTGAKWTRLSVLYIVAIVIVLVVFISWVNA